MRRETSSTQPAPAPRPHRRKERGQAMVEMAFVLPIFLLVVMATVDFGFAFQRYITITNAAREGARFGIVEGTTATQIEEATRERLTGSLTEANVTVPTLGGSGGDVTVQVEYEYEFITPLGGLVKLVSGGKSGGDIGPSITLSSSTTMRRE
jgi:Flp pilus assembly protein TadG